MHTMDAGSWEGRSQLSSLQCAGPENDGQYSDSESTMTETEAVELGKNMVINPDGEARAEGLLEWWGSTATLAFRYKSCTPSMNKVLQWHQSKVRVDP